ncbi:MAG: hypothetical protein EHM28_05995 [Spirochaetaceae bacterium]|nr:MAG: hypothetical protein EHM28_05995 [Spirochaetaceae bacterium]
MKRRTTILTIIILVLLLIPAILLIRHMTAIRIAMGDIEEIQARIDLLEEKALTRKDFSADDKAFLSTIYDAFIFGGSVMGYGEASAMLARYMENTGKPLEVDSRAFRENSKVKTEVQALFNQIKSDFSTIRSSSREYSSSRILIAPVDDPRLFYLANYFIVKAKPETAEPGKCTITFRVDLSCSFVSYQTQITRFGDPKRFHTPFPSLVPGKVLAVDDGLSQHLVTINMAKEFPYYAEWSEIYTMENQ